MTQDLITRSTVITQPTPNQHTDLARERALIDEVIGLAWDDHITFESIYVHTGYAEHEVIAVMRRELKASSFRMWRKRVSGRKSYKHRKIKATTPSRGRGS